MILLLVIGAAVAIVVFILLGIRGAVRRELYGERQDAEQVETIRRQEG